MSSASSETPGAMALAEASSAGWLLIAALLFDF
jgi:hypothetical protein